MNTGQEVKKKKIQKCVYLDGTDRQKTHFGLLAAAVFAPAAAAWTPCTCRGLRHLPSESWWSACRQNVAHTWNTAEGKTIPASNSIRNLCLCVRLNCWICLHVTAGLSVCSSYLESLKICPSLVHWMLTVWRADAGTILQGSLAVCPDRISSKDELDRSILNLEKSQFCVLLNSRHKF